MLSWLQKQAWWISLLITLSVAVFPSAFVTLGQTAIEFVTGY
ncbi:hypothetical protein [Bacillus sp. SIMBA_074]